MMLFKNLSLFQLNIKEIEFFLRKDEFTACSSGMPVFIGWIPTDVVKYLFEEKIKEIEFKELRKIKKKEKIKLKEHIYQSLLPRAFARNIIINVYIDHKFNLLVIDASSNKKIEIFTTYLRKAFGSLKIHMLDILPISAILTEWIKNDQHPNDVIIQNQCILRDIINIKDKKDSIELIKCHHQNLHSDDVLSLINSGRKVTQLGLSWKGLLNFVIDDKLKFKSVKFLKPVCEKFNDINYDYTKQDQFNYTFSIMVKILHEFSAFIMHNFSNISRGYNL